MRLLAAVLLAALLLAAGWISWQGVTGQIQVHHVTSGSMRPGLEAGDGVLVRQIPLGDLAVGDVVRYMADGPAGAARPTLHRVAKLARDDTGRLVLTARGDANSAPDQAVPLAGESAWIAWGPRLPGAGPLLEALAAPPLQALLALLLLRGVILLLRGDREVRIALPAGAGGGSPAGPAPRRALPPAPTYALAAGRS